MSGPISSDRVFGNYPMSIATSLAFEGLFHTGEFQGVTTPLETNNHQCVMVNIRTLFRNAFYAFENNRERLEGVTMLTCIGEDALAIVRTVKEMAPHLDVQFYFCQMIGVNRLFPEAKFKNANTPAQIFYNTLEKDTYTRLSEVIQYVPFEIEIKNDRETLIVTHMPMDLLWRKNFPKLSLLESHTGRVKSHTEWYSKLNGKPEQLPFCKAFLVLFGDGVVFSPLDLKSRGVLLEIAQKYKWHQGTTLDRIYNCLRLENEPHLLEYIRRLSR